jgi:tRNA dimethylallyltransferase
LTRAIEICLVARRPATELFGQGRPVLQGYRILKIGLNPPRDALYQRINQRAQAMFDSGLIDEVRSILARGYSEDAPPFRSHGYRQAVDYLSGRLDWNEAVYHAQTRTRQYAKRQMTWFRSETGVRWLRGFGEDTAVQSQACIQVEAHLKLCPEEN